MYEHSSGIPLSHTHIEGMEMECFGDLKDDEVASAEELRERNPFRAMYELWTQVPLDEKLRLERKIRTTRQRGRSIEQLFYYMDWMWSQMRSRELMKSSTFRKFEEENHLIQFLLALRDEFEPLKRSLLSRSPVPTLSEAILELQEEEARLRSSNRYIETNATEDEDDDEPLSAYLERRLTFDDEDELVESNLFSSQSMTTEEIPEAIYSGSGSTVCNVEELAAATSPATTEEIPEAIYSGSGSTVCNEEELAPATSPAGDRCAISAESHSGKDSTSSTIKILTYNVCIWDVKLDERMKALCDLIQLHTPDIICFQEVRLESYNIFRRSSWWNEYKSSILPEDAEAGRLGSHFRLQLSKLPVESYGTWPFKNSIMGRELCVAEIHVSSGKSLIVATCHLESPDPFRRMYTQERVAQAKKAIRGLECFPNVVLAGDMNWNEELAGEFPIREGWVDAWQKLRPWLKGWTCDTYSNPMLAANRPLRLRSDRCLCKLNDFKLVKISMIGTEPIPGVFYSKQKREGNRFQTLKLPVLPSDHYGLLLEISSN